VEYSLTENGKDLRRVIMPLLQWAARQDNYAGKIENCDPSQLVEVDTG
jgi:DNA-binding HxlR family transcriptional regulator